MVVVVGGLCPWVASSRGWVGSKTGAGLVGFQAKQTEGTGFLATWTCRYGCSALEKTEIIDLSKCPRLSCGVAWWEMECCGKRWFQGWTSVCATELNLGGELEPVPVRGGLDASTENTSTNEGMISAFSFQV